MPGKETKLFGVDSVCLDSEKMENKKNTKNNVLQSENAPEQLERSIKYRPGDLIASVKPFFHDLDTKYRSLICDYCFNKK